MSDAEAATPLQRMFGDSAHRLVQLLDCNSLVLISGPSGIGKSFLVSQAAASVHRKTVTFSLGLLAVQFPGNTQGGVRYYLSAVRKAAAAVLVVIDNIDELAPHKHADLATLAALHRELTAVAKSPGRSVTAEDLVAQAADIPLSTLQQLTLERVEHTPLSSIGGLASVKRKLERSVMWTFQHRDALDRLGVRPARGVLLYGPPGTGKTLLAKAVASETHANFIACSIPQLVRGEVGESEKAIARIFALARSAAPCVVFIDEIDSMFGSRDAAGSMSQKMISQLMMELDALAEGTVLLAATNNPWVIDPALLRSGRLDVHIYVDPPDVESRKSILHLYARHLQIDNSEQDVLADVAAATEGFSGADLSNLVRQVLSLAGTDTTIGRQVFEQALESVRPSIQPSALQQYKDFFGR
ncbi:hypothetical protein RI367_004113 [Sorochytrium milnesiophthora]